MIKNIDQLSTLLEGKYKIGKLLGTGPFSSVYRAERVSDGKQITIKFIDLPNKEAFARLNREINLMRRFPPSPNVVNFIDGQISQDNQTAISVSEFVDGPSLKELVESRKNGIPEEVIVSISRQLCLGVAHLHEHEILHRDIKPSNIFISSSGCVKLGDFGLVVSALKEAQRQDITSTGDFVGTLLYIAPEIIKGLKASIQTDVYAIGFTIAFVILGKYPLPHDTFVEVAYSIIEGSAFKEISESLPPEWREVINGLLTVRPEDRIGSAEDLISIINNTFSQPESSDIQVVGDFLRKIDHTRALSFEPPRIITSPAEPEEEKSIRELVKSLATQIDQVKSAVSDITAIFSRDDLFKSNGYPLPHDRLELNIDKTFDIIRRRLSVTWRFGLAMTIVLFVLFTTMAALAVIFGIFFQKSLWGIVFGSSSVFSLLTVIVWRPMDKMLFTTIATQQLELIHISYQKSLTGTREERREAFRDVSRQLDSLIIRVSSKPKS